MSRKGLFVPAYKYLRAEQKKTGLIKWNMFQVKEGFNLSGTCVQGHTKISSFLSPKPTRALHAYISYLGYTE